MDQFEKESCIKALENRIKDDPNTKGLTNLLTGNRAVVSNFLDMSTPPGFTYHGEKHIAMVEQYVGRLLGEKRIAKLSDEELFILIMGALCHDVGMIKYTTEGEIYFPDRENHNVASYLMVWDRLNNKQGSLGIKVPSDNPKYYKAIALLCLGHRDHKDENKKTIHTLTDSYKIQDCETKICETISLPNNIKAHVQYLAAVLRLADEIDVTNQRAPRDVEMHLKTFITERAKEHWCAHQIFDHVEIDSTSDNNKVTITLVPDLDEIKARIKDPIDNLAPDMLLSLLFERLEKIRDEIGIINKITTSSSYFDTGLSVKYEVDINFDDSVVTREKYEEYLKKVEQERKKKESEKKTGTDYEENKGIAQTPRVSPQELFNKEIQRLKVDKTLLEIGNFEFPFEEYSHYFINTQLLLTNREALNCITDIFMDYYRDKNIDCVVGIGKAGIVLAPNLSLKLKCNSSYLIFNWEDPSSTKWEKNTSVIETSKNILVLLDVISTGTVTKQSLKIIREKNKTCLENIYIGAVFCTNISKKGEIEKKEKVKELFSINDDFQFRTYSQEDYDSDENFRKEFELLPLRKK